MLLTFSPGINRQRALRLFLAERIIYKLYIPFLFSYTGVVGWGLRPTSDKARRFAAKKSLPYIALEDGFLRSVGLGVDGDEPHSLVVDYSGIYYDATRPSDLERFIFESALSDEQVIRARRCMALIREHRLSKYNQAPEVMFAPSDKQRILVVDQTAGDASIRYGLASEHSFKLMLEQAKANHPDAEIWVKIHPDVLAGKKQGHLVELAQHLGCTLLSDACNPWSVLDVVSDVYVVTSQLGFEALLAGKRVHCFGMPFYAGWGLTEDSQSCARRSVERSLEAVFDAAYIRYCRFINPQSGQRYEIEDTIALLTQQRDLLF
ncbi:capsular polysaccharide export protein, LipB/KpsS family [Neptunomonas phycophila]|uniref:capsular polysaccharide export protein, LipB/KpsS family n=1 Tax=Neptunomonas phycophila TaxID=1572645 RepID=UPI003517D6B0